MYNTWTFWNERLNKWLKSRNTNSKGGGETECTLFRDFERLGRFAAQAQVRSPDT